MHHGGVQARRRFGWLVAGRLDGRTSVLVTLGLIAAFLVTRLPWLDADIPLWQLTWYSPIDEFGYSVPAFNLLHYGTWVHQAAPWAPLEGPPINVAQNLVSAATLVLLGDSYWGLRASSIVFGLVAFLALVSIVRRQADEARRFDAVPAGLARLVVAAAAVLLLVDFSLLLSARTVEPTVSRLAVAAAIVALVGRGTFGGDRPGLGRSVAFGAAVAAAVLFVYIYNAFLVPAALLTVAWSAYRTGGPAAVGRHVIAFLAGCLAVTIVFFGLIAVVYGQSPLGWFETWIGPFATATRGDGFSLAKVASILEANVFRLDPAFVAVVLASLPVFAWTLTRRPSAWMVLVATGLVAFLVQAAFVADYPERKFVMAILFALPIAASGILGRQAFEAWMMADHRRLVAVTVWLSGVIVVTALASPIGQAQLQGLLLGRLVLVAGAVGIAALVGLLVLRRTSLVTVAAVVLGLAIVTPLAYADAAYIYRRLTFTYRDALIAVGPTIDGRTTAGGWSLGMQLYNGSRPVLGEFTARLPRAEYEAAVVRLFREGQATALFDYADAGTRGRWEGLGFRLVETFPIRLPEGRKLARYVFTATGSPP
jgi:hypothetical protein